MKNLLFALISFITVPILAMGTELSQLQSKLIGVWGNPNDGNAPLLFITKDYVLVFTKHNKKSYMDNSSFKTVPRKSSYLITKEKSGYYLRSSFWYKIRKGEGSIVLDSNISFLGLFVIDKGVKLKKLNKDKVLKLLEEYRINYNMLRNEPIHPHQNITGSNAEQIKNEKGILVNIEDHTLPPILEEFIKNDR